MAKYYYNDILLPEIPSDIPANYTYKIIRNDTNNSRYDLIFSDTPWHYDSGGVLARKQATSTMLRYYINHADAEMATEWVFLEENDKSTNFGVSSTRPLVWSNSDIKNASGSSVYFVGSEPILVPEEPETEPEPEYKEKYNVTTERLIEFANTARKITGSTATMTPAEMVTAFGNVQTLIDNANAKTGGSDTDLTSAVGTLVEGYGGMVLKENERIYQIGNAVTNIMPTFNVSAISG